MRRLLGPMLVAFFITATIGAINSTASDRRGYSYLQHRKAVMSTPRSIRFDLQQMKLDFRESMPLFREANEKLKKLGHLFDQRHFDEKDDRRVFNLVRDVDHALARVQRHSKRREHDRGGERLVREPRFYKIRRIRGQLDELLVRFRFVTRFDREEKRDSERFEEFRERVNERLRELEDRQRDETDERTDERDDRTDRDERDGSDESDEREQRSRHDVSPNDVRVETPGGQDRFVVCHGPDGADRQLVLPEAALEAHLRHGDELGFCSE